MKENIFIYLKGKNNYNIFSGGLVLTSQFIHTSIYFLGTLCIVQLLSQLPFFFNLVNEHFGLYKCFGCKCINK